MGGSLNPITKQLPISRKVLARSMFMMKGRESSMVLLSLPNLLTNLPTVLDSKKLMLVWNTACASCW